MANISDTTTHRKKRFKFEVPHPFAILFAVILLTALSTYLIPAGEYERTTNEEGQTLVVEGSYQQIESNPAGFMDIFKAIHAGLTTSAGIVFFIFIVGGAFNVFKETKAIEGAFGSVSGRLEGREMLMIPVFMMFFAIGGATIGMFEEALPFILILVPLAMMMGFDSMTGAAVVMVGVATGFTAAFMNPFTVGVAQGIAELPTFSGMVPRIFFWFAYVTVSILFVMRYAAKVKKNPELSVTFEEDKKRNVDKAAALDMKLSRRQGVTLLILLATFIALAYGVIKYGWYIQEISALFVIMAIVIGIVNRMGINGTTMAFVRGCEELIVGALVVGFAYGAVTLLENSNTIDTILYGISGLVSELPTVMAAGAMFVVQAFMNLIVASGSGQAALTMPLMTPLGDLLGVSRQTVVLAFQMGDGITNIFSPTNGLLFAALAMAGISLTKWFKWMAPLFVIQFIMAIIIVTIAHLFIWPA
ncbi:TIGR00366 family protein [Bhargavaea ginsengi]|uniref:YfcC family protein n=1 Tax=Bhargavaea ginsengi TaxID=426757 RepID=UPI002040BCDE|nr:TIGR00366 family protein [Bhargavaea ginsengi]MCM3088359.1 TIGR00366 family protein [Bhargavaea ginsengi]